MDPLRYYKFTTCYKPIRGINNEMFVQRQIRFTKTQTPTKCQLIHLREITTQTDKVFYFSDTMFPY